MSRLLISTNPATTNSARLSGRANTPALATSGRRPSYISCKQQPQPETNPNNEKNVIDRRNVLLGLTSAYGATATFGSTAFANPIQPPDLRKCHLATDPNLPKGEQQVECCPPKYKDEKIIDFKLPKLVTPMRTRRPAHKVDSEYIAKYEEAILKMKELPKDDPWSFYQQAQVHCAFCNGAYYQLGFADKLLQVHFAFLFLPWHRYYVYFWEKILGKLIDDPTFAIPFWNWDTPAGMYLPSIYKPETSPLYNPNRNPDHNEALINFKYGEDPTNPTPEEKDGVILSNLLQIESIFTEGKKNPRLFMGGPIIAGEEPENDQGSLESLHNVFHQWVGPTAPPNWDMGNFHTAARDTVFWGHHANVDRMWSLFTASRGNKPEFRSKDWLDASFIFYDDNRQLVNCKVRDSLDTTKFGYTYEPVELPWSNVRRSYIKQKREREKSGVKPEEVDVGEFGSTPRPLVQTIRVLVPRPKPSLTKDDKEEVSEVLTIDDIVITDKTVHQRFDVYVSKPLEGGKATTDLGEFAGAFTYIPVSLSNTKRKTRLTLGITNLVENLEADASENLVVSLIPGIGEVTIGGVKISLLDVDD